MLLKYEFANSKSEGEKNYVIKKWRQRHSGKISAAGIEDYVLQPGNGIATEKVYNAVLKYQEDNRLIADGMVGASTKALLLGGTTGGGTVSSTLKAGSNGSLTLYLQRILRALGYSLTVNGIFDTETQAVAIAFQIANNLEADGIVGGGT